MELFKSSSKFSKKQIILLSIPVFFSNMAIPLVGMVDTGLMGNLSETKYLAATSIATSVMTMIVWSFGFLRMGTVGIVAQAYGSCLLYTSPSPRDKRQSRMPSSA